MKQSDESSHKKWARFRFSVVGRLLAAPPPRGELRAELKALAARTWRHPIHGGPACFGLSTIERWYYMARRAESDPVSALRRKVRSDAGTHPSLGERRARLDETRTFKTAEGYVPEEDDLPGDDALRAAAHPAAKRVTPGSWLHFATHSHTDTMSAGKA